MNQPTNLAMDQAVEETKKQFGEILFVALTLAWVLLRKRFDLLKPARKFLLDLAYGVAGTRNG